MAIDASIYSGIQAPKQVNPLEQFAQMQQIQTGQNQNRLADLMFGEKQREVSGDSALAGLLAAGKAPQDVATGLAAAGYGRQAMAYTKAQQDAAKQRADIEKTTADAKKTGLESANLALTQHRDMLNTVNSPDDAKQWLVAAYQNPDTKAIFEKMGPLDVALQRFDQGVTTPEAFAKWKQQASLNAQELVKYTSPTADAKLASDTSIKTNAATNATHIQTTGMTNATSRQNNKDTIAKDYVVAGVSPDGKVSPDMDATANAIAKGQLPAPTGMALLNPKNQRILARVMEINPDYDSTTVDAKKKAARDFTSGSQGNSLRSFAVAGEHLTQLGELVDAMNNGNMQLVNKLSNAYSQQTGNPAVTNFDAAKEIVGKEVVKAIVAGGGGVEERRELSQLLSNAKSPAQLKGVITQFSSLMGAQHEALLAQRRAAGLPDSTLPNYKPSTPTGAAPPGSPKAINFGDLK